MKKNLSIAVGIPTCYGGQSLVETVKTLRSSNFTNHRPKSETGFDILIEADRTPWTKSVKNSLRKMGVKSHWNNVEGSQCKKLNQIIKKVNSDIFVFTQDDIIFDKETLGEIYQAFKKDPKLTMVGVRVLPLKPNTFFESVMSTMLKTMDRIVLSWNGGDNYLMANGRCLAFRTSYLKKFKLDNTLINTDMYMYLRNKQLGGKFKALKEAKVYIRAPQSLKDQIGPSSRFQYSKLEMSKYFRFNLDSVYRIPLKVLILASIKEFIKNPINFMGYITIYAYTRLKKQPKSKALKTIWNIDTSTKSGIKA